MLQGGARRLFGDTDWQGKVLAVNNRIRA